MKKWEVLASNIVLTTPWLRVRKDRCKTAKGVVVEDYYVIERYDFVMIFALTPDRRVILVNQYKHGAGELLRELPAGYVEPGEEPLAAAKRELLEETGFRAGGVVPIATWHASPALLTTRAFIFFCDELESAGGQSLDEAEDIDLEFVELDKLRAAITQGDYIKDCASLASISIVLNKIDDGSLG